VTFVRHHYRAGSTPSTATAVTAHTFSGTYRADYGPGTDLEGKAVAGAPPMTGTWDVRSTCGSGGCIATASYVGGSGVVLVSNLVFDQVGGSWLPWVWALRPAMTRPPKSGWYSPWLRNPTAPCPVTPPGPPPTAAARRSEP
jgi:hypothetical protein